jgi:hypothetical protein
MNRYYFSIKDGEWSYEDSDGTDFPDTFSALNYGKRMVRELREIADDGGQRLVIYNARRKVIFSIPFLAGDRHLAS